MKIIHHPLLLGALAASLALGSCKKSSPAVSPQSAATPASASVASKHEAPATPSPPPPMRPEELRDRLLSKLRVSGTLTRQTQTRGNSTFQEWNCDLVVENGAEIPLSLGSDLLLYELTDSALMSGFSVFLRGDGPAFSIFDDSHTSSNARRARGSRAGASRITGPKTYGLDSNFERDGQIINVGGGSISLSNLMGGGEADPDRPETYGAIAAGGRWPLRRSFPLHSWANDDVLTSVCIVLPEAAATSGGTTARVRPICFFSRPAAAANWRVREVRVTPVELDALRKMLADSASALALRVMAANWLAESFPAEAPAALVEAARPLREGNLLGACLRLLTGLKSSGFEQEAIKLVEDTSVPTGIRRLGMTYLGAMRCADAEALLISNAADLSHADEESASVRQSAVNALGLLASEKAVARLIDILKDSKASKHHYQAARSLAGSGSTVAIAELLILAKAEGKEALGALAEAAHPSTFAFFKELPADKDNAVTKARGLRSGGAEAVGPLLRLVEDFGSGEKNNYAWQPLASVVSELDLSEATPKLIELARAGNKAAAEALANSLNDSVHPALTELALSTTGEIQKQAVRGLAQNHSARSFDTFATVLKKREGAIPEAVRGLAKGKQPGALELIMPLLEGSKDDVRDAATTAVRGWKTLGNSAGAVAEVALRSADGDVLHACAEALISSAWSDHSKIPDLGKKLAPDEIKEDHWEWARRNYSIIRLLRQLSNDAMGPADGGDYFGKEKEWVQKWSEWAARNSTPAKPPK